jgi:hypothetical protein
MGHRPPKRRVPPDRESFHLGMAREAYVRGSISVERFEECVEHVLRGGHLPGRIEETGPLPAAPPLPPPPAKPMIPTYR